MSEHEALGECSRCHQRHCIEGVPSSARALHLVCHHHGVTRETEVRAKVCTDCGYVEFWVRKPSALKLHPEVLAQAAAEQSDAVSQADW